VSSAARKYLNVTATLSEHLELENVSNANDTESGKECCAFCAKYMSERDMGEYEISWRYKGVREKTRGYYICIVCKNSMDNALQAKVEYTWMKIKARSEKPCCGGGG
jgi:hypothetical protein